jgi:TusA-related sulfurtransferase
MSDVVVKETAAALGESVLEALARRDFDQLEALFAPHVRFRALVPPGVREGQTAREATDWLRRWFGEADTLQVLSSAADQIFDRLYLRYRLRLHDATHGWRVIEQQAYCDVRDGRIADMWLLCSGFRPDPEGRVSTAPSRLNGDVYYDAGARPCTDGPLEDIAGMLRHMPAGQTLEVHASATSVAEDLPAWCRLAGHELIRHDGERFLIRRK